MAKGTLWEDFDDDTLLQQFDLTQLEVCFLPSPAENDSLS